ncbi:MAG: hypothetical protein ACKV2Q_23435 [Planctomycetaceae bacterium]
MSEVSDLLQRVTQLENENARIRRQMRRVPLFLGLAIVCVTGLCGAAFQNAARVEKAVEVFDGNQTLRAVLYADNGKGESGMDLKDRRGNSRLSIRTGKNDDAFVNFFDANGKVRIDMGISGNGEAYLHMIDGQGNIRPPRLAAPN